MYDSISSAKSSKDAFFHGGHFHEAPEGPREEAFGIVEGTREEFHRILSDGRVICSWSDGGWNDFLFRADVVKDLSELNDWEAEEGYYNMDGEEVCSSSSSGEFILLMPMGGSYLRFDVCDAFVDEWAFCFEDED